MLLKFSGPVAIIGSAAVFSAAHFDLTRLLDVFYFGVVLRVAYWKYRSLGMTIAAHALMNGAFAPHKL